MSQISLLQKTIHAWALRKEWRGPNSSQRPFVADLALFHSEISEALECLRENDDPRAFWFTYTVEVDGVKFSNLSLEQLCVLTDTEPVDIENTIRELELVGKPEGVGPELADLMIRVLETAEEYGIDLDFEIERKMAYNESREIKHGGKLM